MNREELLRIFKRQLVAIPPEYSFWDFEPARIMAGLPPTHEVFYVWREGNDYWDGWSRANPGQFPWLSDTWGWYVPVPKGFFSTPMTVKQLAYRRMPEDFYWCYDEGRDVWWEFYYESGGTFLWKNGDVVDFEPLWIVPVPKSLLASRFGQFSHFFKVVHE